LFAFLPGSIYVLSITSFDAVPSKIFPAAFIANNDNIALQALLIS
jgi:hypothetical protein